MSVRSLFLLTSFFFISHVVSIACYVYMANWKFVRSADYKQKIFSNKKLPVHCPFIATNKSLQVHSSVVVTIFLGWIPTRGQSMPVVFRLGGVCDCLRTQSQKTLVDKYIVDVQLIVLA